MTQEVIPTGDRRLRAAVRCIVDFFREFEQAARAANMTVSQYRILLFLRIGPQRAGELAALAAVKKPSITPIIAALEERGWISRETDPDDRRSARLAITESGREAMWSFEQRLTGVVAATMPADQRDNILDAFVTMGEGLLASREDRFRRLEEELLGPERQSR